VVANGMAVMIKTTFDERLADYAVGRVILYNALQHLFSRENLRVAEFYTNASRVWLQWASGTRPIYHFDVYRYAAILSSKRVVRAGLAALRSRKQPSTDAAADVE